HFLNNSKISNDFKETSIQFSIFFRLFLVRVSDIWQKEKRKPLKMEGNTKDSTKGGDGSAQKYGAGVEHKYNFQLLYHELD
ncbi:hypothetical protein MKX03_020310, partial [Papaver bracteatum]